MSTTRIRLWAIVSGPTECSMCNFDSAFTVRVYMVNNQGVTGGNQDTSCGRCLHHLRNTLATLPETPHTP